MEELIKKVLAHKSPGYNDFTGEFYQIFSEKLTPILLKLFQNVGEEQRLPNTFHEATIILISKSGKICNIERRLQGNIADEHRCYNLQQNIGKLDQAIH